MAPKAKRKAKKRTIRGRRPSATLRIAVTFPRAEDGVGPTRYGARLASDVISDFVPDYKTIGQALGELQTRGFEVTATGRVTASIRAPRSLFERTFGTKLSVFQIASSESGHSPVERFYFPAADARWKPNASVRKLIDDAYIQWPHIYTGALFSNPSPLPPRVDFHHLRVPQDVAALLNATKVHREGGTGKGIKVAMIDTGFAHHHPYFSTQGYNSSVVLAPGANEPERDGDGHGTGESANVFAVAPDIHFIGVKLNNEQNPSTGATLLEGLQEAIRYNPDIITVSIAYDMRPLNAFTGQPLNNQHLDKLPNSLVALEAEVQAAVNSGIIMIFAAGNSQVAFPAMMPGVISAGGAYVDDRGGLQASDFASAFVSKIYPGRRVPDFCGLVGLQANHASYIMLPVEANSKTDKNRGALDATSGADGWALFSGTSAAAPQIAGVCALLLEKNPGLTPFDIKNLLRLTAIDVTQGTAHPDSNEDNGPLRAQSGIDNATGAGLVDAFAAWRMV